MDAGIDEAGDRCSVRAASQQSSQNHSSSRSLTVLMPTHGRWSQLLQPSHCTMMIDSSSMPHLQPKMAEVLDRANEAPVATDLREELATEAGVLGLRPLRWEGVSETRRNCFDFRRRLEGLRALAVATAAAAS